MALKSRWTTEQEIEIQDTTQIKFHIDRSFQLNAYVYMSININICTHTYIQTYINVYIEYLAVISRLFVVTLTSQLEE